MTEQKPATLGNQERSSGRRSRRPLLMVALLIAIGVYLWWTYNNRDVITARNYQMMGTLVTIKVSAPKSAHAGEMIEEAAAEMVRIEKICSSYMPDSYVSRLNRQPAGEPLKVKPEERDVLEVLRLSRKISDLSGGAFDITYASVGQFWDFNPEHPRLPTKEEIEPAIKKIDYHNVVIDKDAPSVTLLGKNTKIGLGGIAKGYAVDKAVECLRGHGVTGALINAGGDIYAMGYKSRGFLWSKPQQWKVGVRHPREKGRLIPGLTIQIRDKALVTSGDYERSFVIDGVRYHHIIDPRTGYPATGAISVTVIAESSAMADGVATACFVMGPKESFEMLKKLPGVEAMFVTPDMKIVGTSGIPKAVRDINLEDKAGSDKTQPAEKEG